MSREDEKSGGIVAINRYKIGSDRKRRAFKDERNDPAWQSGDRSLELGVSTATSRCLPADLYAMDSEAIVGLRYFAQDY